jgi:hypothetical protein
MAALEKFNPVNFSKNITKTISAVDEKIGRVTSVPQSLTDQLNAKTGINIAAPPLPPINANVKGLVGSVKTLVKNPNGVVKDGITAASGAARTKLNNVAINTLGGAIGGAVSGDGVRDSIGGFVRGGSASLKGAVVSTVGGAKSTVSGLVSGNTIQNGVTGAVGAVGNFAKSSFGIATVAVRGSLTQIKGTLRLGIKNCLRSAVSSLLSNISSPNIPFGGITPSIPNGVSVNGVITSAGAAGAIELNKKINKHLNAEISLLGTLDFKRKTLTTSVTGSLDIIKDVKNTNFYTAKLTSEVNSNINKICNTLSPRNKKKLSKGGPIVDMVANVAADSVVNNLENQVVQAASGFSAKGPKDFFNSVTGLPSTVNKRVDAATSTVATGASNTATSVVSDVTSGTARAYNNIKNAINSNVPSKVN